MYSLRSYLNLFLNFIHCLLFFLGKRMILYSAEEFLFVMCKCIEIPVTDF